MGGARIFVRGIGHTVQSIGSGEYWRLLAPGQYTVSAEYQGVRSESVPVTVSGQDTGMAIVNLQLQTNSFF